MSIKTSEAKEGIDVRTINYDALIEGPYLEPVKEGGANYYKCADCGYESLRRYNLKRAGFHADGCIGSKRTEC